MCSAADRRNVVDVNKFDDKAATWDDDPAKVERAGEVARAIRAAVPLNTSVRMLEYGAGTGLVTQALLYLGVYVVGWSNWPSRGHGHYHRHFGCRKNGPVAAQVFNRGRLAKPGLFPMVDEHRRVDREERAIPAHADAAHERVEAVARGDGLGGRALA